MNVLNCFDFIFLGCFCLENWLRLKLDIQV